MESSLNLFVTWLSCRKKQWYDCLPSVSTKKCWNEQSASWIKKINHADLESEVVESGLENVSNSLSVPPPVKPAPKQKSKVVDVGYTKAYNLKSYDFGEKLKEQLEAYKTWWKINVNGARQGTSLSPTTLNKRSNFIFIYIYIFFFYIYYIFPTKNSWACKKLFGLCLSWNVEWQKEGDYTGIIQWSSSIWEIPLVAWNQRQTKPGTLVEHIGAAISVIKFLNRDLEYNAVGKNFGMLELVVKKCFYLYFFFFQCF